MRSFTSKTYLASGQTKILGKFCSMVGGSGKFVTMDSMNPAPERTISFEIPPFD
jgi:hypothetical protein